MAFVGFRLGYDNRKKNAESKIGSAEEEAKRIVNEAVKAGEAKRKEIVLEGKDELHKLRLENDKEIRDRRSEVSKQEKRAQQKEDSLNRKIEQADKKLEQVNSKLKQAEEKLAEAEKTRQSQMEIMEKISGFTAEQAKEELMKSLDEQLLHEKVAKIKEYEQQLAEESEEMAQRVIGTAIQRSAAPYVIENTSSVVPLPNDEMKGRIIGREGRNIRSLESATGVNFIIDDTPEAITITSFNPVRREIARVALNKLISDGRIHPKHIEETVAKAEREVENSIKKAGEDAVSQANVFGLHPELIKLLGKLRYRTSFGQNVLQHSIEVSLIAGAMAAEIGADPAEARRAGLLHDIGKAVDYDHKGQSHVDLGVDLATKYRENARIVHAIAAHHGNVEPTSLTDILVQSADAISAARPGARRENIENYIARLQKLEDIAKSFNGVEDSYAIQAGRELRVIVKPEVIDDDQMVFIARNICQQIKNDMDYPGQIRVSVIRENRVSEIA